MPVTPPLSPDDAPDSTQKIYSRIAETIGDGEVSPGYQMMGNAESYCKDSYMNFRKFIHDGEGKLDDFQRKAIVIATSSAMNCHHCVRYHAKQAAENGWTQTQIAEVLAVAATCSMYNTYFKFKDMSGDSAFEAKKIGLYAHTFSKTSLDDTLVELINIVVSNINGCMKCTSGHVKKALELGLDHDAIDQAVRISATMASFNVFHRTQ